MLDQGVLDQVGVHTGATTYVCALLVRPGADGVTALAAALASEGAVAALNPALTLTELADALNRLRPAVIAVEASTRALATEALMLARSSGSTPAPTPMLDCSTVVEFCAPGEGPIAVHSPPLSSQQSRPAQQVPADRKLIIWTSGTTGTPRAIALRGEGVLEAAQAQTKRLAVEPGASMVTSLPLAPVGGLMIPIRAGLAQGVVEAVPAFDAEALIQLGQAGRADHISLVPVMLQRLVDALEERGAAAAPAMAPHEAPAQAPHPAPRFGTLLIGGAACPQPLVARAQQAGLKLALTWGMTESAAQAATALPADVAADAASVGPSLDHVEVRATPEGRMMLRLAALDPAELKPADVDSADVDAAELVSLTDPDGWFVTGDLGFVADDGRIFITGRAADRIITGGFNVDPGEVERVLLEHKGVADAVVVGLPDEEWGEKVCAAIVPAAGTHPTTLLTELDPWVRPRLTSAKRPRRWAFVDAIPRTAADKVDRAAVRAVFSGGHPLSGSQPFASNQRQAEVDHES